MVRENQPSSAPNDLSIQNIRPMEDVVASAVGTQRFALQMVGLFAVVALVLALTGIYGGMSHAASRRAREIAIRIALAPRPGEAVVTSGSDGHQFGSLSQE